MSDDHFQTVQETEKTNYFKKLAAPLAVAGVCGAAALLFAGAKTATPSSTEMIQQPFLRDDTELRAVGGGGGETCSTSWDRMWSGNNSDFIGSANMMSNLSNGQYEDPSFPANDSMLWWDMQTAQQGQIHTYETSKSWGPTHEFQWVRPSEYRGVDKTTGVNKPSLFGPDGVQVRTSEQGELGDCWFLSSATAVAQTPSRIHSIFNGVTEYNDNGAFNMFFYVRGERIAVHIDDRIPFIHYGPRYSTQYQWLDNRVSQDGAWWLVLLEKAMAKLNVNYTNLNSGRPGEALRALTGAPVINYQSHDITNEKLWDVITSGMNHNYPMVGGTGSHPAFHVTDGHAETCLGSLILLNPDGSEHERLIKMRNPWGKYQYDGPWSRHSDLWTPEFKKQADYATADDGVFYTPLSDWVSEYENLAVSYTQDWEISSIEGSHSVYEGSSQAHSFVTFTNPVEQDVMVECDQYTTRLWPQTQDGQCKSEKNFPQAYQGYLYTGEDNYWQQTVTYPANIQCHGESFVLNNLAAGQYNVQVYNFNGSDSDHGIWHIRTFAEKEAAPLRARPNLGQN